MKTLAAALGLLWGLGNLCVAVLFITRVSLHAMSRAAGDRLSALPFLRGRKTTLPASGIDSLSGFITLIITISALPLLRWRFRPGRAAPASSEPAAVVRP